MKNLAIAHVIALSAAAFPHTAACQGLPPEPNAARTVQIFDRLCLRYLPNIDGVARAAAAAGFEEVTGHDLKQYRPELRAEQLRAWRFDDLGTEYVIATALALPDEAIKAELPGYADAEIFSCSLQLSERDAANEVLSEMSNLMGRDPGQTWEQPPLHAHAWAGEIETLLVHIYYYAPLSGDSGGVLAANVIVPEQADPATR